MTPAQWRLSRQITDVLATEVGLADRQLAQRLGVTATELKPVVGALIGMRRLDYCAGYLVLPVAAGRDARAA